MRKQRLSEGLLSMVFTLLHYVHAYIIYKVLKKRLDLTGLIIGSFLPDLEIRLSLEGGLRRFRTG